MTDTFPTLLRLSCAVAIPLLKFTCEPPNQPPVALGAEFGESVAVTGSVYS
ncbi:Uncharacterised protein [Vibrio cholerae]|nr:Uncharacterised protein [Vibrio cholerae]CSH89107.1 Uncharacterised protein [Vibrio cholerae]